LTSPGGLFATMTGPVLAQAEKSVWMPEQASTGAGQVDQTFYFFYWIAAFFFVLITALLVYFTIRFRKRKGAKPEGDVHHNTPLEVVWTVIPTILVVVMFYLGFKGFMDLANPPQNAYLITVTGQKWKWLFTYPNGHVDEKLHVPANTDVKLRITSEDVLHSPYIPAFRIKQDAVPGRYTYAWFNAKKPGTYRFFCAEYCGTSHSDMITDCVVHPKDEFAHWLDTADPLKRLTDEQYQAYTKDPEAFVKENPDFSDLEIPAIVGRQLYEKFGCTQCHLLDGRRLIGPSFKGLWGSKVEFEEGDPVIADENYIRESILDPNKRIVKSYERAMPTFRGKLKDRQIYCLIEFIRSLEDKSDKPEKDKQ
jgi:cytochrome c oxidase subunit 2